MRIIAIAAVTAGGKTTLVNALKSCLPRAQSLHFDDYAFEGAVEDFHRWTLDGADYHVWNLRPLIDDISRVRDGGQCDYLFLDYPFGRRHGALKTMIDCALFIDTPLDVALARRVLRDMSDASGDEIRTDLEDYLKYARIAYLQMLRDIMPASDHVIDGTLSLDAQVALALHYIKGDKNHVPT